jgi:hypothetical protein
MGFSLDVSIPLVSEGTLDDVLARACGGSFFQPVAVGAIEGHRGHGDHWFLAGYALEHFLAIFLKRSVQRPASISMYTPQDAELDAYQHRCADAVRRPSPGDRQLSPFERVDEQVGVTVLEPKHLTEEIFGALTSWTARFPKATIYVYGAIRLSLQKPARSAWTRAFQEVGSAEESQSSWEVPFLILRLYAADPFVGRRLMISTQSHVWLREVHALGGRVTPEDADANLQELASFARTVSQGKQSREHAAELSMDGRFYTREEARIRAAFQDLF